MVGSMFAGVSGLKAHQTRMDVLGNNIANVNTWGYKSQLAHIQDAAYRTRTAGSANRGDQGGGNNTSQVGYGANVGYISVNYTTGNWNPTGWGGDCMINGPAFFAVTKNLGNANGTTRPDGNAGDDPVADGSIGGVNADGTLQSADIQITAADGIQLSRVGIFGLDEQGYLVDANGYYVLNYKGNAIQARDGYTYDAITIQKDGTITAVIQSPSQDAKKVETLGQLGVVSIQNINGLEHDEGYYYDIGPNAGITSLNQTTSASGDILGGYLEMSNTDLANEISYMITTQRGYQANTKIITVTDEMLQELVNMKR